MDYAYHSDLVEEDKKKNELEETAFKTISNLKFCNFVTKGNWNQKKKYPVNFCLLKEMCQPGGILEDAHIFKYLFGFEVAGSSFEKKEEGFDFSEYDIDIDDWNTFLTFIKFGHFESDFYSPKKLMEICNKFGGIPAFDRWYQSTLKAKNDPKNTNKGYNPMTPQEDIKQLYLWSACPDNRLEFFGRNNNGYSVAGHHKLGTVSFTYYWRKLKTPDSAPVATPVAAAAEPVIQNRTNYSQQEIQQGIDDMHDFRQDTILENFDFITD